MNRAASILACDMRGLGHENLACLAAELALALDRLLAIIEYSNSEKLIVGENNGAIRCAREALLMCAAFGVEPR